MTRTVLKHALDVSTICKRMRVCAAVQYSASDRVGRGQGLLSTTIRQCYMLHAIRGIVMSAYVRRKYDTVVFEWSINKVWNHIRGRSVYSCHWFHWRILGEWKKLDDTDAVLWTTVTETSGVRTFPVVCICSTCTKHVLCSDNSCCLMSLGQSSVRPTRHPLDMWRLTLSPRNRFLRNPARFPLLVYLYHLESDTLPL